MSNLSWSPVVYRCTTYLRGCNSLHAKKNPAEIDMTVIYGISRSSIDDAGKWGGQSGWAWRKTKAHTPHLWVHLSLSAKCLSLMILSPPCPLFGWLQTLHMDGCLEFGSTVLFHWLYYYFLELRNSMAVEFSCFQDENHPLFPFLICKNC